MKQQSIQNYDSQLQHRLGINQFRLVVSYLTENEIRLLRLTSVWFYAQTMEHFKRQYDELLDQTFQIDESYTKLQNEAKKIQSQDLDQVKNIFEMEKKNYDLLALIKKFDLMEMKSFIYPTIYVHQVCHIVLVLLKNDGQQRQKDGLVQWNRCREMLGKSDFIGSLLALNAINLSDFQIFCTLQAVQYRNLNNNHTTAQALIDYVSGLFLISQVPLVEIKRKVNMLRVEKHCILILIQRLEFILFHKSFNQEQ